MKKSSVLHFLSFTLLIGGLILILNTGLPILVYEISAYFRFQKNDLLSPLTDSPLIPSIPSAQNLYPLSLTSPSQWFEGDPKLSPVDSKVSFYNLSIPRLKIQGAVVEVGGEDLSKNLIHYKGTALPGQLGNTVIFGHSSLPQFFSPKNYLSIFSKLPTLEIGDKLIVDYDGITYTYQVEEMFEVKPTNIEVLAQRYDDSYLSLITCVPPGTYFRRLIVRSRLVPVS